MFYLKLADLLFLQESKSLDNNNPFLLNIVQSYVFFFYIMQLYHFFFVFLHAIRSYLFKAENTNTTL
jgi:hypothetical protein